MPENSIQADTGHLKRHPFLREPLLFIPQLQVQPRVNKHQLESLCQDFPDVTITIIESSPGSLSSREEGSNPTDSISSAYAQIQFLTLNLGLSNELSVCMCLISFA